MAIRAAERRTSEIEYENTFTKVNGYLSDKVKRLPKRHLYYIGRPMNEALNRIYEKIIKCTDLYLHDKGRDMERYKLIASMMDDFREVAALSYFWWNLSEDKKLEIKYIKENQRKFWTEGLTKELVLLNGVAKKCKKSVEIPGMRVYTRAEIRGITILEHLHDLQNVIYKRALQMNATYRDPQMEMLIKLSRDAFYNALEGNHIRADTEKEYKQRKKYIGDAIGNLFAMNRPVRELAFTDTFTENELANICTLVNESLKMLKAIQASDKERREKLSA